MITFPTLSSNFASLYLRKLRLSRIFRDFETIFILRQLTRATAIISWKWRWWLTGLAFWTYFISNTFLVLAFTQACARWVRSTIKLFLHCPYGFRAVLCSWWTSETLNSTIKIIGNTVNWTAWWETTTLSIIPTMQTRKELMFYDVKHGFPRMGMVKSFIYWSD